MPPLTPDDLTLTEKASLTSGADTWRTSAIERLGLGQILLTDGPHGVRKEAGTGGQPELDNSLPATCFPPAVGLAATFDPELVTRVGQAIGTEAAAQGVAVVLGPGMNIKRSPLGGRNFEYFSEDPVLSGFLGAGLVRGIQSAGVGASVKHFAANNQETDRMRVSADIDPRALHEIYLRGFEIAIRTAEPWTGMCAYNRINGQYASQDHWLLTAVLRHRWRSEGLVVSEWGAVDDRVAALAAGLDLEMPATGGYSDALVVRAVQQGELDEASLDLAVGRLLHLIQRSPSGPTRTPDLDRHHDLAREAAARSIVLLRNQQELLPLTPQDSVAVIGAFADQPRYQGAGSSHVSPTRMETALQEMRATCAHVTYAPGFRIDPGQDDPQHGTAEALRADAVAAARAAHTAVVFLGLPPSAESEGFDRSSIDLPTDQLHLLRAVLAANPRTAVVLSHGGLVRLPEAEAIPAIVDASLLGQAGGGATADVLFGRVNPSGRLAETIPHRLQDTPSFGNFPGEHGHARYGEGLLVGYRWYDARDLTVAFPFGHGLSYTTFDYGQASATCDPGGQVHIEVPVRNSGERDGHEVVQVYLSMPGSAQQRPVRELKGFASVLIPAGRTERVRIQIRREELAYWHPGADRWVVEDGEYHFQVGASSRDLRSTAVVQVDGETVLPPLTRESSLGEVLADPDAAPLVRGAMADLASQMPEVAGLLENEQMMTMMSSFPVGRLPGYGGMPISEELVSELLETANTARTHRLGL